MTVFARRKQTILSLRRIANKSTWDAIRSNPHFAAFVTNAAYGTEFNRSRMLRQFAEYLKTLAEFDTASQELGAIGLEAAKAKYAGNRDMLMALLSVQHNNQYLESLDSINL